MHFKLSDYYKAWNSFFDIAEIFISVCLCGVTFLDFKTYFKVDFDSQLILGIISIFLLAFTLTKQRLNFKEKSEQHYFAGKMYCSAKIDITNRITQWENYPNPQEAIEYMRTQYIGLNDLVQIPENKFTRLKHHHQHKADFSKFLDKNKRIPYMICILKYCFLNCFDRKKKEEDVPMG